MPPLLPISTTQNLPGPSSNLYNELQESDEDFLPLMSMKCYEELSVSKLWLYCILCPHCRQWSVQPHPLCHALQPSTAQLTNYPSPPPFWVAWTMTSSSPQQQTCTTGSQITNQATSRTTQNPSQQSIAQVQNNTLTPKRPYTAVPPLLLASTTQNNLLEPSSSSTRYYELQESKEDFLPLMSEDKYSDSVVDLTGEDSNS